MVLKKLLGGLDQIVAAVDPALPPAFAARPCTVRADLRGRPLRRPRSPGEILDHLDRLSIGRLVWTRAATARP